MNMNRIFSCGDRIRELRQERGLSQERLALNADITPAYLGLVERGKKNPTVLTIERICTAMGISLADFFSICRSAPEIEDDISKQILYHLNGLSKAERSGFLTLVKTVLNIRQLGIENASFVDHKNPSK